jgi:hypothetical protein
VHSTKALSGVLGCDDMEGLLETANEIQDPERRFRVLDAILKVSAFSRGLGGEGISLEQRLKICNRLTNPRDRDATSKKFMKMSLQSTRVSEIAAAANSGNTLLSSAARKTLTSKAARRTSAHDSVPHTTHMCVRPVHADHLSSQLTDVYKLDGEKRIPVCDSVSVCGANERGMPKHSCLGKPKVPPGTKKREENFRSGSSKNGASLSVYNCGVVVRDGWYHPNAQNFKRGGQ